MDFYGDAHMFCVVLQQVPPWVNPHRGDSIVLQFAGVNLSVGVVLIDSLEVLCMGCRALYTSWLLETPAKGLPVQNDYKGMSSVEKMVSLVPVDWGLRRAQRMGHWEGQG